jgi:C_GCAxxG_C_C family probable redox protein
MSVEDEVRRVYSSGLNCAESLLLVVSEHLGLNKNGARFIPRIATGFGGGIARNGDVCGALSGSVMAISLAFGRERADQSVKQCYAAVDQFYNDFVKTFGSGKCLELCHFNFKAPGASEAEHQKVRRERCSPIVEWATKTAIRIIKKKTNKRQYARRRKRERKKVPNPIT